MNCSFEVVPGDTLKTRTHIQELAGEVGMTEKWGSLAAVSRHRPLADFCFISRCIEY